MIDPKILRNDFDRVLKLLETRSIPSNLSDWPRLDQSKRALIAEGEKLRADKNRLGPEIAKAKKLGEEGESEKLTVLLTELKKSSEREAEIAQELSTIEQQILDIELMIPNIPDQSVPIGRSEEENRVEKIWGDKRDFDFEPKPHWEIGENLGILNFEQARKLSGARFVVYHGFGAKLERALINFMLDCHAEKGYQEVMPPLLVREETMIGSGQFPKFKDQSFKTGDFEPQLFLVPTSEVALCNLHSEEIIDRAKLPLYYTSFTPCFRSEAGSHGRDVRGLIRMHQFNKVELVKICEPDKSFEEHEKMVLDAESILEKLNLPYRRITLCTGDMGLAAMKTYDLEVWLPSQSTYREISSVSNVGDFQSRRTKTRFRSGEKDKPEFVHMLNGSGLAVGRTLLAILENYQQKDGSVIVPEVLRPYLNGLEVIK